MAAMAAPAARARARHVAHPLPRPPARVRPAGLGAAAPARGAPGAPAAWSHAGRRGLGGAWRRGRGGFGEHTVRAGEASESEDEEAEVPTTLRRRRRTRNRTDGRELAESEGIENMVVDKRARKRQTQAKARRRNRRYANRLTSSLVGGRTSLRDLRADFDGDDDDDDVGEG